jgi:hypothetical protein
VTDWRSDFAEFARGNLPVQSAERMIGLLRPAARLYAAASGEVVVGAARRRGAVAGEHGVAA